MPVTKTAKRALRSSKVKRAFNDKVRKNLEIAQRLAVKKPTAKAISTVSSLADKAAKVNIIHKNKAARIKAVFSKLIK